MIHDYFLLAVNSIKHRRLRSLLNVIGIVIGVAAIVSLISVSQGLENAITAQFEQMGTNRIFVMPEAGLAAGVTIVEGLSNDDVKTLEKMAEFKWVNPFVSSTTTVEFNREEKQLTISGMNTDDMEKRWEDFGFSVEEGRFLMDREKSSVIIGVRVKDRIFEKDVRLNNQLIINDEKFRVVGVMEEIGNEQDDSSIIMNIDAAREILDVEEAVNAIDLVIKPGLDINEVAEKTQRRLERARDNDDFEIVTPDQLLEQLGTILSIVQIVLVGIAAISLLVGGIGITNSMYTSVLERTREIGIMKSIGASNVGILTIFLIESGLMGLVGGFFGIIIGALIAEAVEFLAKQAGFALLLVKVNLWLLVFGLGFAFVVGMLSGALPAMQAAKLKPVEALRY